MHAFFIVRTPPVSRNKLHNWGAIATHMYQGDVNIHGGNISYLTHPLFPPTTYRAVNERILADHASLVGGGKPSENKNPTTTHFRTDK